MKTLWILRHAHALPSRGDGDHGRPLSDAGVAAAREAGARLRAEDAVPDRILTSGALRARTTAERVAEAAGFGGTVQVLPELYDATAADCVRLLNRVAENPDRVLLVGHNPAVEELIGVLTGRSAPMPPAGLARIDLPVDDWHELKPDGAGRLAGRW